MLKVVNDRKRCSWASDPLNIKYHDTEWGVPEHSDQKLFEMLILEGAQAGLNWTTILRKRENYKKAFDSFQAKKIAKYNKNKVASLLKNDGIIRNKLKIASTIQNAKAYLKVTKEFGSFDNYIWQFKTSIEMSKDLLKRGFKFVGPTICFAFMQAVGMVNNHEEDCFRYKEA